MKQNPVFLLLGANLGSRKATLQEAIELISEQIAPITTQSSIYETAPWGVTAQPAYLNQVVGLSTYLHPIDILERCLKIEKQLGRQRRERWDSRTIDIDILYYDSLVMKMTDLVIPHPRLHERRFTLVPLTEIAAEFVHPSLKKSSKELLEQCTDDGEVNVYDKE